MAWFLVWFLVGVLAVFVWSLCRMAALSDRDAPNPDAGGCMAASVRDDDEEMTFI